MTTPAAIKTGVWTKHRLKIMIFSLILFLPPLSFLFQFTGDSGFCGVWCPRMFFVWRHGTSVGAYFAGFVRSYMGAGLLFGILAVTVLFGRFWCSHFCPVGGAMELGSRLVPRFLKINFSAIPAPAFRYGYLAAYLLSAAFGIGSLCCRYCNFATLPRLFGAAFSPADMAYFLRSAGLINLGLVVFLGFLAKGGRAYCNLLCPIGALDSLTNRISSCVGKRFVIAVEQCNGCGKCKGACPVWAIEIAEKKAHIDPFSCIPCGTCQATCPNNAIVYGKGEPAPMLKWSTKVSA